MKMLTLALFAGACAPALAQTDNYAPEGTSDSYVGVLLASIPRGQGDSRQRTVMLPFLTKRYSNGVFLTQGAVGMQLSGNPGIEYGPLLAYGFAQRADARDDKLRLKAEAGSFVNYSLMHGVSLNSTALFGGGDTHRGLRISAGATVTMPLAAHQSVSFRTGVSVANRSYLESFYGVPASPASGVPGYSPSAGLRDMSVGGNWDWQLNNKYSLATGVGMSRLLGSAADSPIVRQRNNANAFTSLSYHY